MTLGTALAIAGQAARVLFLVFLMIFTRDIMLCRTHTSVDQLVISMFFILGPKRSPLKLAIPVMFGMFNEVNEGLISTIYSAGYIYINYTINEPLLSIMKNMRLFAVVFQ